MSDTPPPKDPPLSKLFIWGMIADFAGQSFLVWNATRCYYQGLLEELPVMGVIAVVTGALFVRKVVRIYRREYPKVVAPADSKPAAEPMAPTEPAAPIESTELAEPPAVA
jgi:hypothetical protein